jgi:hypothetical protein
VGDVQIAGENDWLASLLRLHEVMVEVDIPFLCSIPESFEAFTCVGNVDRHKGEVIELHRNGTPFIPVSIPEIEVNSDWAHFGENGSTRVAILGRRTVPVCCVAGWELGVDLLLVNLLLISFGFVQADYIWLLLLHELLKEALIECRINAIDIPRVNARFISFETRLRCLAALKHLSRFLCPKKGIEGFKHFVLVGLFGLLHGHLDTNTGCSVCSRPLRLFLMLKLLDFALWHIEQLFSLCLVFEF